MKGSTIFANLGAAILAVGTLAFAAVDSRPRSSLMSPGDYDQAVKEIDADARVSMVVCKRLSGYEKKVCNTELAAEKLVRSADLEARYLGTVESQYTARITRVEAQFDVDRERCAAFTDDGRDRCLMIAVETRAALINEMKPPA